MTRLSAILLFAALLAVPATAQAETITIVKPPAQPPVQTVGVKPTLGHNVPVLVVTAPKPQVTLDTPLIFTFPTDDGSCCYDPGSSNPPSDPPYSDPSEEPGGSDEPSEEPGGDSDGNPLTP